MDAREMTIATVAMREELIEAIENALDFRQPGVASRGYQALVGFDSLAERLGILDDRSAERWELNQKIIDSVSISRQEVRVHVD